MPLTEEDIKVLQEKVLKPIEDKLTAANQKIADFEAQFPSMSKKHAGEATAEAKRLIEELAGRIPKPEDKKPTKPDEIAELNKKIEALTQANVKSEQDKELETRKAEVASALASSKVKIVKGLERYAHADLMKLVDRDGEGKLVMKFKDKIAGIEVDTNLDTEKGIERFLKSNPVFAQADVKGGSGAGGGNSFADGVKPTNAQLMANAALLAEWINKDPEHVQAEQNKAVAELEATRGKRQR